MLGDPVILGSRRGGGVAIYCADYISAHRRHDLEDNYIDCVWIECFSDIIRVLFCTYNRPPGQPADKRNTCMFLSHFESSIDLANDAGMDTIIRTGDFNDKYICYGMITIMPAS